MVEAIAKTGPRKCDELAGAVNRWLHAMANCPAADQGSGGSLSVGVIGYRTDQEANPVIEPGWAEPLAGKTLVSIDEVREHPLSTRTVVGRAEDKEPSEELDFSYNSPVWVDPRAEGSTPMCHVLHFAHGVLCRWIRAHPHGCPPVVVHFTDGESQDGNPAPYADAVRNLATSRGNTLFLNCHLSTTSAIPVVFPSSETELPDHPAHQLFRMSSVLPEQVMHAAVAAGFELEANARGMAYNADPIVLLRFLGLSPESAD
jgi:hypothetical protein